MLKANTFRHFLAWWSEVLRSLRKALGGDLHSVRLIYLKAALFLLIGLGSSLVLLSFDPSWTTLVFLSAAIWGCCRFYYICFYVIDRYIDPGSRHASLSSFVSKRFSSGKNP